MIISNCVINLSGDKDRVLREAFRVLKPGGRFAVSDVVTRGEVPAEVRRNMLLWVGCIAGALGDDEYAEKLATAGFQGIEIEPTRVYDIEDARTFLSGQGVDVDVIAPQVEGKFLSAFIRAAKPASCLRVAALEQPHLDGRRMTPRHFNVLFLCTGNSARSVMAEAIMNRKGFPNFTGFSAGSHPTGHINPEAFTSLPGLACRPKDCAARAGMSSQRPDAPQMHFVFTVCDSAAAEVCPVWPGHPYIAKWSVPDPAAVRGTAEQVRRAFFEAFTILDRRITLFLSLPLATLEREIVQREIDQIGRS